jgi:beta-glucosidase
MWLPPSKKERKQIDEAVAVAKTCDVVICVVGDLPNAFKGNQSTSGENRSRTSINLTGRQDDLIRAVCDTGKPTVVVHISGRPNSINWAQKKADAILHAFYPGMFGGDAIAEALFGDLNPGGHLTATFLKCAGQVELNFPATPNSQQGFNNISANNPLYPFGYGLSYTKFKFSSLNIDWPGKKEKRKPTIHTKFIVSCNVENIGERAGDTVAQLYIRDVLSSTITYSLRLRGFERISLKPGESKTVRFEVDPQESLWLLDLSNKRVVEPGQFNIYVGDCSVHLGKDKSKPGIKLNGSITLVKS